MDVLLTVDELADHLKISKKTIYNLVSQRRIPYLKACGALRFSKAEIEQWIRQSGGMVQSKEEHKDRSHG